MITASGHLQCRDIREISWIQDIHQKTIGKSSINLLFWVSCHGDTRLSNRCPTIFFVSMWLSATQKVVGDSRKMCLSQSIWRQKNKNYHNNERVTVNSYNYVELVLEGRIMGLVAKMKKHHKKKLQSSMLESNLQPQTLSDKNSWRAKSYAQVR